MIRSWEGFNLGRRDVMIFIMCLCVCWVGYLIQSPKLLDEVPQKLVLDEVPQKLVLDVVQQTQTTVNNQNHLWITLAKHILSKKSPKSNVVFSPLSIHGIMGLTAAGSKGQTLDQVLSFLKTKTLDELNTRASKLVSLMADGSSSGGPSLSSANSAWIDQTLSLKASFKQVLDNVYKATCKQVNFLNKADEAVVEVNSWAEKQTNGLIKGVLPADAVSIETRLILANAVYFKGTWKEKFDPSMTQDSDFHLIDGSKVKVPFMRSYYQKQLVCDYDGFKVLGLPYSQGEDKRRFTMYMFLPNEKDTIPFLIEKIGSESDFLERYIPRQQVEVGRLMIPKFNISSGFEVSDMLKELGLVLPFTTGGLTEIADESLRVSSINHKAFLEVNEEGTEAAAATTEVADGPSVNFTADHPFLFVIREDVSGEVLFMGQVVNPSVH
ncbi:serine protease inhibitor (SERPIN) family protein [Artemisia annua]|uniref:Serine protease inhibitor (SERPIN) family protein n=1 Tax=Artemisia annua TaxID=35608 RepID=A0A2U1M707_ARTAN|nr:serine protease inhibitor (SERPIN) family protein [Artemisia annua]